MNTAQKLQKEIIKVLLIFVGARSELSNHLLDLHWYYDTLIGGECVERRGEGTGKRGKEGDGSGKDDEFRTRYEIDWFRPTIKRYLSKSWYMICFPGIFLLFLHQKPSTKMFWKKIRQLVSKVFFDLNTIWAIADFNECSEPNPLYSVHCTWLTRTRRCSAWRVPWIRTTSGATSIDPGSPGK